MTPEAATAYARLEPLVGVWTTRGWTRDTPPGRIEATDTYERLPGGALLHIVDARVGEEKVDGAEIIGYEAAGSTYLTQYFGTDGPATYEASLTEEGGALTWRMRTAANRFTGSFNDSRTVITGHWELLEEGSTWKPWMDVTLTRRG